MMDLDPNPPPIINIELQIKVDAEDGGAQSKVISTPIELKSVSEEENPVLKKLLCNQRQWRYFDSEDGTFQLEGRAVNSVAQKRRKPCYVCADVQHNGKRCRKRRTCYTCNGKGHIAEDCPKSDYDFCLRCGESGHDLFSCFNDYPSDDLKNIRCYVCNKVGHLCCGGYIDTDPTTSSCCNCGESGHPGFECPKPRVDKGNSQPPSICYKCGDQDHIGRNCTVTNTGVASKKCSRDPEGEVLDPNKSDLTQDESGIADPVMETDDASRRQHQKKSRKNKAFRYRRVRRQKKWSTDTKAE